jgi:Pyruvate/2-oxoacid:ferredoxin oxidoreductase gamma subunit
MNRAAAREVHNEMTVNAFMLGYLCGTLAIMNDELKTKITGPSKGRNECRLKSQDNRT